MSKEIRFLCVAPLSLQRYTLVKPPSSQLDRTASANRREFSSTQVAVARNGGCFIIITISCRYLKCKFIIISMQTSSMFGARDIGDNECLIINSVEKKRQANPEFFFTLEL